MEELTNDQKQALSEFSLGIKNLETRPSGNATMLLLDNTWIGSIDEEGKKYFSGFYSKEDIKKGLDVLTLRYPELEGLLGELFPDIVPQLSPTVTFNLRLTHSYHRRGYFLSYGDWEIVEDEQGAKVLVPKHLI